MSTKRSRYIVDKIRSLSKASTARKVVADTEIPSEINMVFETAADFDEGAQTTTPADEAATPNDTVETPVKEDKENDDEGSLSNDDILADFDETSPDDADDDDDVVVVEEEKDAGSNDTMDDGNDDDMAAIQSNGVAGTQTDDDDTVDVAIGGGGGDDDDTIVDVAAVGEAIADCENNDSHPHPALTPYPSPTTTSDVSDDLLPIATEVVYSIQETFAGVRATLGNMSFVDHTDDRTSVLRSTPQPDMALFATAFPDAPLEVTVLNKFHQYYSNLTTDDGEDVLALELAKRATIYRSISTILHNDVPSSIMKMLLSLGAKTFIVAFHAISEGFDMQASNDIFETLPGVGVDVTDTFDDFLGTLFHKGCELLCLDHAFRQAISRDCVSFYELLTLTTM